MGKRCEVAVLVGQVLTEVRKQDGSDGDEILFVTDEGSQYKMYHRQDCCESVGLEDVVGDFEDLLNTPILVADERCDTGSPKPGNYEDESSTWTFYTFRTIKGSVDLRWYGSSNGYYSESVDFEQIV